MSFEFELDLDFIPTNEEKSESKLPSFSSTEEMIAFAAK